MARRRPSIWHFTKPYQFVRDDFGNEPVIYAGDWQVCKFAADDETIQRILM